MNTYRAVVKFESGGRYEYDIDASSLSVAASRALSGFSRRDEASVTVKLIGRSIVRPRIERQSHGRARAVS